MERDDLSLEQFKKLIVSVKIQKKKVKKKLKNLGIFYLLFLTHKKDDHGGLGGLNQSCYEEYSEDDKFCTLLLALFSPVSHRYHVHWSK